MKQWQNTLNKLNQDLEQTLKISISPEFKVDFYEKTVYQPKEEKTRANSSQSQYTYSYAGKGIKEDVGTSQKSTPKSATPKSTPNINNPDLEKTFQDWEIDEEIAQMKSEMHSSGFKNQNQNQNQNNQKTTNTKPKTDKDKLIRAYNILGLKSNASPSQIKQAYKTLVRKWHPDLFVNQPQQQVKAQEKIRLINEAYDILT